MTGIEKQRAREALADQLIEEGRRRAAASLQHDAGATVGWTCPVCHRGVAPAVPTCDHGLLMVHNQAASPDWIFSAPAK